MKTKFTKSKYEICVQTFKVLILLVGVCHKPLLFIIFVTNTSIYLN